MVGPSVGESFAWAFSSLGELFFKWVPATIATVAGAGTPPPPGSPAPAVSMVWHPVTVPEAVQYLQAASDTGVWSNLYHQWSVFVAISLFISLILTALVIYCAIRIQQIRYHERTMFDAMANTVRAVNIPKTQLRWQRITEQMESDDEHRWRLAILEADIMLNELLDTLGYKGETMADKMKQVAPADLNTIDLAWEAHKARNRIAHEGTHAHLSKDEAQRIIGLYRRVFRESNFIE
ncbi:MAG: hypothetical protein NUV59_00525 [Patescibacteria group bacterium]|nr:hypothetical protein [Patescibacteria group bacterium]